MVCHHLRPFGESVFSQMTRLAQAHGAINLGQGFPEEDGPDWLKAAAVESIWRGPNQYAPSAGDPLLRAALAAEARRAHGLDYCPETEVTVCSGATGALVACFLGLLNPGDEVILLAPVFDCYIPAVLMAGGVPRFLTATAPDFAVDLTALEALITPKTRALLLNTPWNPCGKVFTSEELTALAQVLERHPQVVAVTDEVYEHIVFAPHRHRSLASIAGMRERTLVVSSFAKSLSMTGWKIGYVFGPPRLTEAVRSAHQFLTFCAAAPLQSALAGALERLPDFFPTLLAEYQERCEVAMQILKNAGLEPLRPQGTYFLLADVRVLGFASDLDFCLRLPKEVGVAAFPASTLYRGNEGQGLVRWAFCKRVATLEEAGRRLEALGRMPRL